MERAAVFRLGLFAVAAAIAACGGRRSGEPKPEPLDEWTMRFIIEFQREPDSTPTRWRGLLGEYGPDTVNRWFTIERDGRLWIRDQHNNFAPLAEVSDSEFTAPVMPVPVSGAVRFTRDSTGRASAVRVGDLTMLRRDVDPPPGTEQLRITPVRPIEDIRREAMAASPPSESGRFDPPSLVDVAAMDSTIRLDIRYATENNFLGARLYESARAFMQRPAAEALVRVNKTLRRVGYGLLVHDAYRPWYVTKVFWEATPADKKWLVADPAQGSRHNRGVAVDLTLYDLRSRRVVEMPSTYDEATTRAHSTYPGGTSLQRHYRLLLRRAMESEGFAVHPQEWWHFDYVDFKKYAIGNVPFEEIGSRK